MSQQKPESTIFLCTRSGPIVASFIALILLGIIPLVGGFSELGHSLVSGVSLILIGLITSLLFSLLIYMTKKQHGLYVDFLTNEVLIPKINMFKRNQFICLKYEDIIEIDCVKNVSKSRHGLKIITYTIQVIDQKNNTYKLHDSLFTSLEDFQHCYKMLIHRVTSENYNEIEAPTSSSNFVFSTTKEQLSKLKAALKE